MIALNVSGYRLRDIEMAYILAVLEYHNGNRTHAAETLCISLRTLRNKINEYEVSGIKIPPPQMRTVNGR